jgi:FimV-like protein
MRKLLVIASVGIGLVTMSSLIADPYSFSEPPTEQSLVRPGEERVTQPSLQQVPTPEGNLGQLRQEAQKQTPPNIQNDPDDGDSFFLKPTYVTQEDFNIFKRQVVQVLRDTTQKADSFTQQLLDMKIQIQQVGPQMASLKQMMMQMSELLAAQSQAHPVTATVWQQWWFWFLATWSLFLTLLFGWLVVARRKDLVPDTGPESGGDYDFLSQVDSLPAHLDLARTYMAMHNYAQARRSLEFVIMKDSGEFRQQALKLLKQLPKG